MNVTEVVARELDQIQRIAEAPPPGDLRVREADLLDRLTRPVPPMVLPRGLFAPHGASPQEYRVNWDHQVWYHLGELLRIHQGRRERAMAQGGDAWTNVPQPAPEQETWSQLNELAKLRGLVAATPRLVEPEAREVLFDGPVDGAGWEHPTGLEVEVDAEHGTRWQGQNPGGDWFWLTQPLPPGPTSFRFDVTPISTIRGGLIVGFCVRPLKPDTPLAAASGPTMGSYFNSFDAYHFSVHRGSTGYCNLRRCGPGLVMLASFDDPCPEVGRRYEIRIVVNGPQIELRVDGRLVCCYVDMGFIQPRLDGGHFGLRHFQGFNGRHRRVRITRLGV